MSLGLEPMSERVVVVDLAIEDRPHAVVFVGERLMPTG